MPSQRLILRGVSSIALALLLVATSATSVLARDPVYRGSNDNLYFEECDTSGDTSGTTPGSTPGGAGSDCAGEPLPESVPKYWRDLINETAAQYPDVDRRTVAAELWVENRGWPDPNKNWATSGAGAQGPWQFIPSTWASMGTDGDGDGVADPNNPRDAVHAAFKHNEGTACKPILEGATGDAKSDYENVPFIRDGTSTLMSSIANYNGRGAQSGKPLAQQTSGDENSDYVKMAYWLIATDFQQTIDPATGEMIDATSAGAAASGSGPGVQPVADSNSGACQPVKGKPGANAVNEIDGANYAFPVQLGKTEVTNGYAWPCPGNCHHDGTAAFDLSRNAQDDSSEGVPVIAITNGTIEMFNNSYAGVDGCQAFQLVGEDGHSYWYGHVQAGSVQNGASVTAGQGIAEIGRRACTGNGSYPHLHIDRGAGGGYGGMVGSRDANFTDLINKLWEAL